jgi:hypothetical protein
MFHNSITDHCIEYTVECRSYALSPQAVPDSEDWFVRMN